MSQQFLDIAKKELGVHETPGPEATARIMEYEKATNRGYTGSDEEAWCAKFACWVVEQSGHRSPRSAAAIDFMHWGTAIPNPQPGCIVVLSRKTADNPNSAHVCFWAGDTDDPAYFLGLGGNQSDSVCISKQRYDKVLGFRTV